MNRARAWFKLGLFVAWTASVYGLRLTGGLFTRSSTRRDMAWGLFIYQFWSRAVCRILGLRVIVHGPPPRPPFFLVANHLGYVDTLVLPTVLKCFFVAKSEVVSWPVLGILVRTVYTIFIERGRRADLVRANDLVAERLGAGNGVVVFPEATSTDGHKVVPFKPGLLEAAIRSGVGISCAAIAYALDDAEQRRGSFVGELHHHLLGRLDGRAEIQEISSIETYGQASTLIVDGQLFAPFAE